VEVGWLLADPPSRLIVRLVVAEGRFTFPAQLRSALLSSQQLRHQFAADAQVGGTPETSFARGTIEV
jgi:hypothetical protein